MTPKKLCSKQRRVKRFWDRLFTPKCFGAPQGKLLKCAHDYVNENAESIRQSEWLPCKHYKRCLKRGLEILEREEKLADEKKEREKGETSN